LRRLFQVIALLGLVFVANATAMPALRLADHAAATRPDAPALLSDGGGMPADALIAAGSCEDWDDETKPACPQGAFVAAGPHLVVRPPSARSRPRRSARVPDRRTATLVGVVVFLI
jgi:hypothetical protein